jgi:serine/threonine protein kinase
MLAARYRLDAEIGRGAMGTVWDAYDEVLRRRVAIKEVDFPAGMPTAEVEQLADRTLREARAIAALSHPHVITLYDILTLPSGPVIVMELMRARSLAEVLAQDGPLDDQRAAVIGRAVAGGLIAAHAAGITHRDVKPANVLIGDDGRIKLTDFGIARSVDEHTLTATGMLLGSPAYISPEVAMGRPASPAADAWGLGALLYAAVQGRPPFDRGDPIATLTAVVTDPVPPHTSSGRLRPIIDALLVKDPGHRISLPQADEMLAGLTGPADGRGPAPLPPIRVPSAPTPQRPEPPVRTARTPRPMPVSVPRPDRAAPPPPWEAGAARALPPLPATAPPPRRAALVLGAILVLLAAAAAGYFGVLAVAGLA